MFSDTTINGLFTTIMKVEPTAWFDHRIGASGVAEYSIYAEGHAPEAWFADISDCLVAYAEKLKAEAEVVDRKTDEDITQLAAVLVGSDPT